jgi:hypothetical protein
VARFYRCNLSPEARRTLQLLVSATGSPYVADETNRWRADHVLKLIDREMVGLQRVGVQQRGEVRSTDWLAALAQLRAEISECRRRLRRCERSPLEMLVGESCPTEVLDARRRRSR